MSIAGGVTPQKQTGNYNKSKFANERKLELNGLFRNGKFEPVNLTYIPTHTRIFGSKLLDELRKAGEGLKRKSCLIAQGYNDEGATFTATKSPTIQQSSQILLMALGAYIQNVNFFTRDITHAYLQSSSKL